MWGVVGWTPDPWRLVVVPDPPPKLAPDVSLGSLCRSKDLSAWDRAPVLQGVLHPRQPPEADLRGCQPGLQDGRRRAAQHPNGRRAAADRAVHPSAAGRRRRLLDRPPPQSGAPLGWCEPGMPVPVLLAGWEQG